jgi:Domain of unknown function (DUF4263)
MVGVGNLQKSAAPAGFSNAVGVSERPKSPVSLQNSLLAGNLSGDGFDEHCVASHAFLRPATVCNRPHIPGNPGFSRIRFCLQVADLSVSSAEPPKVPGLICQNSRFAEIFSGDSFERNCRPVMALYPAVFFDRKISELGARAWTAARATQSICGLKSYRAKAYGLDYRIMRQFGREMTVGGGGTDSRNKPVIDFLMSFTDYTVLVEIKTPSTPIFAKSRRGRSGTWEFSGEFMRGVSQMIEQKAEWLAFAHTGEHFNKAGDNLTARTRNAKSILVIGSRAEFLKSGNERDATIMRDTFELFRRESRSIDIVTFDELLERAIYHAKQIAADHSLARPNNSETFTPNCLFSSYPPLCATAIT